MPSSTEVAEKQLESSSASKWVGFKTPHPYRAIPQLLCTDGAGAGHTHTLSWDKYLSIPDTSPSSLPTQLLEGIGGRMTV